MRRLSWLLAACTFHPQPSAVSGDGGRDAIADGSGSNAGSGDGSGATTFHRTLTIDNTGLAELDEFPLAVSFDPALVRSSPDGHDLRFVDAGGANLAYDIESWGNPAVVWVRVGKIAANATTEIDMRYGDLSLPAGEDRAGTWDSDFIGVWHLVDASDATARNASSNHGATAATTSAMGPAMHFSGTTYVDTASQDQLGQWTIEAWIHPANASGLVTNGSSIVARFPNYLLLWDCNQSVFCQSTLYNSPTPHAGYTASAGAWTHVAGTFDGTTLTAYGGETSSAVSGNGPPQADGRSATIGIRDDIAGGFTGDLDEVRISKVARSADYMRASSRNITGGYLTIGPEQ